MADSAIRDARRRKAERAKIEAELFAFSAGVPLDEDGAFLNRDPELEVHYGKGPTEHEGIRVKQTDQVGNTVVRPKQCEVANVQGQYKDGIPVWVDRLASRNLVSPQLLAELGVPSQATAPKTFETVHGSFTVDQSVELRWKGRERQAASTFYVLPDTSPMLGIMVGIKFIAHYGDDVFSESQDPEPIYLTVRSKPSEEEKQKQAELKAQAEKEAEMLKKKRNKSQGGDQKATASASLHREFRP